MNRTGWLAVVVAVLGLVMFYLTTRWPTARPPPCPPEEVRLNEFGVAWCGRGTELTAVQKLTIGLKLDLNTASADDLALVPGIGPQLARDLVRAREQLGRFRTWDEVDQVPGVGGSRLNALQTVTELRDGRAATP